MNQVNLKFPSNSASTNLITSTIINRQEEYIMITKKELQMIDKFNNDMNILAEVSTIFGSAGLGFILNMSPSPTKDYVFIVIFTLIMICLAFYSKFAKKDAIEKVLKLYQDKV